MGPASINCLLILFFQYRNESGGRLLYAVSNALQR